MDYPDFIPRTDDAQPFEGVTNADLDRRYSLACDLDDRDVQYFARIQPWMSSDDFVACDH